MVLLLACETWWPFIGFLPVTWQTRDIGELREIAKAADYTGKLEQPALGEGNRLVAGNDEVIEDLDLDQLERLLQVTREELGGAAGLGDSRRMVVGEDHRRRIHP